MIGLLLAALLASETPAPQQQEWNEYPNSLEQVPGAVSGEAFYGTTLTRLGVFILPESVNLSYDFVRITVGASFDTTLTAVIHHYRHRTPVWNEAGVESFVFESEYTLEVVYLDFTDEFEKIQDGNHRTDVIHRHWVEISSDEFDEIMKSMIADDFLAQPQFIPKIVLTADGAGYWAEIRMADHHNLIDRRSGHPRFVEDFHYAEAVLNFAAKKIPELDEKLSTLMAKIRK